MKCAARRRTTAGGWALLAAAAFVGTLVPTGELVPAVVSCALVAGLGAVLLRRR